MAVDKKQRGFEPPPGTRNKKTINKNTSFLDGLTSVPQRAYLVFVLLVLIIFTQILSFDFTRYDDSGLINAAELKLSNIGLIFQKGVFHFTGELAPEQDIYYRPIQNVVYAIGNALGGRQPLFHHLISVILHFAVSVLLFRFLISIGYRQRIAFLATIIFIAHPLLVQAVAWIPGVGELLITLFLLLSFICLHKYLSDENINFIDCALSNVFFLLALLSKESALGFIPVIFMYALLIHKNRQGIYRKLLFYCAWLIPLTVLWIFLRQNALGQYAVIEPSAIVTSLLNNSKLIVYYIGKIFIPLNLSPLQSPLDSGVLTGVICIVLFAVVFFVFKKKRNITLLIFGIVWYMAFLIPTLFIPNSEFYFYSYNHRLYLPFIGILIVLIETFALNSVDTPKKATAVVLFFALIFSVLSFSYAKTFKNKYNFFNTIIDNSPHSVKAFETLGNIYYEEKNCDKALNLYLMASELHPETHGFYGMVGNTYGNCYHDLPKAIEWYLKAMAVDSVIKSAANTAISLGNIYSLNYRNDTAAAYWYRKAIVIDSSQTYPMGILGNILFALQQPDSAKYWYNRVLAKDSLSSVAHNGMGLIAYKNGQFHEAISSFSRALQHDTSNIELVKNLMLAYQAINDKPNTRKYAEEYKNRGGPVPEYTEQYLRSN